jgi:hypothetical protein
MAAAAVTRTPRACDPLGPGVPTQGITTGKASSDPVLLKSTPAGHLPSVGSPQIVGH